jgi:hypothetical protein
VSGVVPDVVEECVVKIRHSFVGGSEVIDLGSRDGYVEFARNVIQDFEVADETIVRLAAGETVTVNEAEPEFFESFEPLDQAPVFNPMLFWLCNSAGRQVAGPYESWEAADSDRRGAELTVVEEHLAETL